MFHVVLLAACTLSWPIDVKKSHLVALNKLEDLISSVDPGVNLRSVDVWVVVPLCHCAIISVWQFSVT